MYLGIDLHKRYAQVTVINDAGEIVEEVRVENANLNDLVQRYARFRAVIEATSNYYRVEILDKAQPADETGLVRLLDLINSPVKLFF